MRVLMTADAVGGVWQYVVRLAALLASRNTDVLIAVMGPAPSSDQVDEATAIPRVRLCTHPGALEWMPDAWPEVDGAAAWLLQLELDFAPDVVHLNGYVHANLPWRAPTLVVAHSCVRSWWEAVYGCLPPAEWEEYRVRVTAGLNAATAIAAPTRSMAGAVRRLYGVPRRLVVIPNCAPLRSLAAGHKEPFVFAAGRLWDAAKNLGALNEAANGLTWPVSVAGDLLAPNGQVTSLPNLHTLGRLDGASLANWMDRAAIYALPARYEPFGLSVMEAAMSECALVLGDISSLRENWFDAAHFVPPDRPDELRRTLQRLIDDPIEREALGRAARRRAESFSPASHVAAYERLYQDMVAAHGRIAHTAWTV